MRVIDGLKRHVREAILSPSDAMERQADRTNQQRRYRASFGKPIAGLGMSSSYSEDSTRSDDWTTICSLQLGMSLPLRDTTFKGPYYFRFNGQTVTLPPVYDYSLIADYVTRGASKPVTLDQLAAKERKHLAGYRRALRKAEKQWDERRARALEKFEHTKSERLGELAWRITKTNIRRNNLQNKLRQLVAAGFRRNYHREPSVSELREAVDRLQLDGGWLDRLHGTVVRLTSKIESLKDKMNEVYGWEFAYPDFTFGEYKPRWYDLVNKTTCLPCSLPFSHKFTVVNPTTHYSFKATPVKLELDLSKYERYNWGDEEYPWIETYEGKRTFSCLYGPNGYNIPHWARDNDVDHGHINYDRQQVVKAIKSMVPNPAAAGAASIPLFLVDLKALPSLGTQVLTFLRDFYRLGSSVLKTARTAYGLRRYGASVGQAVNLTMRARDGALFADFVKAAKLYSAADLYRKFGAEPTVEFIMNSSKVLLEHVTAGDKKLLQFLRDRGKELTAHRTLHDAYERDSRPIFQVAPGPQVHVGGLYDQAHFHLYEHSGWDDWSETTDLYGEEALETRGSWAPRVDDFFSDVGWTTWDSPFVPRVEQVTRVKQVLTAIYSYDQSDALGWQLDDEEIRRRWCADKLGLFASASALWDAIPYSFLVNFLVNVDQLVRAYDITNIRPETTLYRLCISEKRETTCRVLPGREFAREMYYDLFSVQRVRARCHVDHSVYARCKSYRRELISVPQEELPGIKLRELAWFKLLTATELVLSKL